jgi:hypothetical protein
MLQGHEDACWEDNVLLRKQEPRVAKYLITLGSCFRRNTKTNQSSIIESPTSIRPNRPAPRRPILIRPDETPIALKNGCATIDP